MSDTTRPTSNTYSIVQSPLTNDAVPATPDDKTQSATAFIGDRQYVVTASSSNAAVGANKLDPFAQAFKDALDSETASGFSFGARDVRLHGPAGEQHADPLPLPTGGGTKSDGIAPLDTSLDDLDDVVAHDITALNEAYERPVEGDILASHIRQLTLPGEAKRAALNFIEQAIGRLDDTTMMAVLGQIHATQTSVAASEDAASLRGAAALRTMLLDNSLFDDDTQTVIGAILGKSAHLQAMATDEQYRDLDNAIATHRVAERRDSPASARNRDQALVNALTQPGNNIPDSMRKDLYNHFKP